MTVLALFKRYHRPSFVEDDPLCVVKKFTDPVDIEIAGFFAALLSYGRVEQIIKSLNNLFERMEWKPSQFIREYSFKEAESAFKGFKHRFNNSTDMALLSAALGDIYSEYWACHNFCVNSFSGL